MVWELVDKREKLKEDKTGVRQSVNWRINEQFRPNWDTKYVEEMSNKLFVIK